MKVSLLSFYINRLEDGDVLSPYDDLSFLMYTDSEVTFNDNNNKNFACGLAYVACFG